MGFYNGSKMRITIDGDHVFHETDATLSYDVDFKEIASKDTDGVENSPGKDSWSLASSAYVKNTEDTKLDIKVLTDVALLKKKVSVAFTDGAIGHVVYSGNAFISNFSIKSTTDEVVTFDYTLKGDGKLILTKVAS
ncbi:conserved hypothetical protein [Tenacibaculum sp. 190524A02b]